MIAISLAKSPAKLVVSPGITIPICSLSKNPASSEFTVEVFNNPLPNTKDVVLSSLISVINLFGVFIYSRWYWTATSSTCVFVIS